jgi:hypothetical protein
MLHINFTDETKERELTYIINHFYFSMKNTTNIRCTENK